MRFIFIFILALSSICFSSCTNEKKENENTSEKKETGSDTIYDAPRATEDSIIDAILLFPAIIRKNAYIDSASGHTKSLAFMIQKGDSAHLYQVQGGINDTLQFQTHFHLLVNTRNKTILYADPVSGENITMEAWDALEQKK